MTTIAVGDAMDMIAGAINIANSGETVNSKIKTATATVTTGAVKQTKATVITIVIEDGTATKSTAETASITDMATPTISRRCAVCPPSLAW